MEDTHWDGEFIYLDNSGVYVLILVLMEDTHWDERANKMLEKLADSS